MRNKFPGTCYRCGENVEANAGHFERFSQRVHGLKWPEHLKLYGRWLTQHADCAIKYRGTNVHFKFNPTNSEEPKNENHQSES